MVSAEMGESRFAGCRVRDWAPGDWPVLAEIYNESVRAGAITMDTELKTAKDFQRMIAAFHERERLLVLERDGGVLGWGLIKRYSDRYGYRTTCETAVYLRLSQTGRGLGSLLKRAIIARCRALGYRHLVAKIMADNHACITYNKKFGYEIVGVQKEVGFLDGAWLDVVIMQCILTDVPPPPDSQ